MLFLITTATVISIFSSPTTSGSLSNTPRLRARTQPATGRASPSIADRADFQPAGILFTATTGTVRSPTSRKQAGIAAATESYGMTVVTADFDEDGWPDIFVACDSTPSLLFMNNHDGTFREEGVMRGVALSDDGMEQAGMGVGIGDYNLDGHLDLFKTHFIGDTSGFYRNDGKGNFDEVTRLAKVGVETRFTSWGAGLVDLDNDGYPDVLFVTGSVYPEVERKLPQYPYKTPRVLFRNLGNGTFEELESQAGEGITTPHSSRGCAFGDFDNDGDMDVLIVNMNEPPSLLAKRHEGQAELAEGETRGREIEPQRDRSASAGALRRARCRRRLCSASPATIRATIRACILVWARPRRPTSMFTGPTACTSSTRRFRKPTHNPAGRGRNCEQQRLEPELADSRGRRRRLPSCRQLQGKFGESVPAYRTFRNRAGFEKSS